MRLFPVALGVFFALAAAVGWAQSDELRALITQGDALFGKGDYKGAIPIAEQALSLAEQNLGEKDAETARRLALLGTLYLEHDRLDDAEAMLNRARELRVEVLGPDHPDVADSLERLSALYLRRADTAAAKEAATRALDIRESAAGSTHPDVTQSLLLLAEVARSQSDVALHRQLTARAYEIVESLSQTDLRLADILIEQARLDLFEAPAARLVRILERALSLRVAKLDPTHPAIAEALQLLGVVYARNEQRDASAEAFEYAQKTLRDQFGERHPRYAGLIMDLAMLDIALGRNREAERRLMSAREILTSTFGPDHLLTARLSRQLAQLKIARKEVKEAEALLLEIRNAFEARFGPEHPELAEIWESLIELYQVQFRFKESEQAIMELIDKRVAALGPEHVLVANAHDLLARQFIKQSRLVDAEAELRKSLGIRTAAAKKNPKVLLPGLVQISDFLVTQRRFDEALPLAEQAVELAESLYGSEDARLGKPLELLANVYRDQGRFEEAKKLFDRVKALNR